MRALGFLLIAIGFVFGSLMAVQSVEEIHWPLWGAALAVGVPGIILARLSARSEATSSDKLTADIATIEASLVNLVAKAEQLNTEKAEMNPYDVRHHIDQEFMVDLDRFVQARTSLTHRFGVQAYADIMSHFATGERYLNRSWSASADGYVDEVNTSLDQVEQEFRTALELFQGINRKQAA